MKIEPYVYRDLSPMPQSELLNMGDVGHYDGWCRLLFIERAKTGILADIETLTNNVD